MPPPRPHLLRCVGSKLHGCPQSQSARSFSTTASPHLPSIGPESPQFIHVPRPPQPDAPYHPHIKGILPTPRQIFPKTRSKKETTDKTSPSYLDATTPPPSARTLLAAKPADPSTRRLVEWRAKVADHRRRNLRESLGELKRRKDRTDKRYAARSAAKQEERAQLLSAPAPADEKYTSPSVLQSSLPKRGGLPDPDREARVEQKRRNYANALAMKQTARRNALHTLYMNARDFIVTEEQLTEAVEKVFDPQSRQFDSEDSKGLNVWNLGYPDTVKEMLERASQEADMRGKALEQYAGNAGVMEERMRRLSEELTGGKM
ncbi:MAG: hypothetical protein LQ344_000275 [Seirophora lacunosa]|nr:MAG: hypothetical protein LQ344_000275 [Seirophora lacunosa]